MLPFQQFPTQIPADMQLHASCAARDGFGVLLEGASGAGKSELLLRLLDHRFRLVADDRVEIAGLVASAPAQLAGLIEIRGLGICRLPYEARIPLVLSVRVTFELPDRLPGPRRHEHLDLPQIFVDPRSPAATARIGLALDCTTGRVPNVAGGLA